MERGKRVRNVYQALVTLFGEPTHAESFGEIGSGEGYRLNCITCSRIFWQTILGVVAGRIR
jgi:hypothetical protein